MNATVRLMEPLSADPLFSILKLMLVVGVHVTSSNSRMAPDVAADGGDKITNPALPAAVLLIT